LGHGVEEVPAEKEGKIRIRKGRKEGREEGRGTEAST